MKPSVFETPTDNLYYKGDHEITSLQVLKAFAAFAVVMIHTNSIFRFALMPILRNAVPLFFMITGYFLLDKNGVLTVDRLKRSIFKLLKLTIVAQCFYLVVTAIFNPSHLFPSLSYPGTFLLFLNGDWYGFHLWYLNAVVAALISLYIILRFEMTRLLPFITVFALLLNLLIGSYAMFWLDSRLVNMVHRNFFTIGIPCLYLGMCIRRYEHKITISSARLIALTILLYALLYVEYLFILKGQSWGDIFLLTIPTSICTFIVVLRASVLNQWKVLATIGRKDSLNIYVLHVFVWKILRRSELVSVCYEWLYVSILTLLLSIAFRKTVTIFKHKCTKV
jgi:peptidoglycan/LPS O-acetylase OafA/YrhL